MKSIKRNKKYLTRLKKKRSTIKKRTSKYRKKKKGGSSELEKNIISDYLLANSVFNNTESVMENLIDKCSFDSLKWGGKEIFKMINLNTPAPNQVYTDNKYFCTLFDGGHQYFFDKYKNIFDDSEELDNDWKIIAEGVKAKTEGVKAKTEAVPVIFGPAELLYPFTKNGFYGLSHFNWTPNLNYNYILHLLSLIDEIFFIIPSYNNISNKDYVLNNFCTAAQGENYARATMNELLLLHSLLQKQYINVEYLEIDMDKEKERERGDAPKNIIKKKTPKSDPESYNYITYEIKSNVHKIQCNDMSNIFESMHPAMYASSDYRTIKSIPCTGETGFNADGKKTTNIPYRFNLLKVSAKPNAFWTALKSILNKDSPNIFGKLKTHCRKKEKKCEGWVTLPTVCPKK